MTIEITRQEQSDILGALREAQDVIRGVYVAARERAGVHDPDDQMLTHLYTVRDALIGLERPIQGIDAV